VLEEPYEPIEMPVLEPEEMIEVVESGEVTDAPPEMAPPSLVDIPTTVDVATFTQLMQPTLDPSLTSVGSLTIPKMTGNFGTAGTAKIQLFDLKDLDRVPRRIRTKVPEYPMELRRAGITGEVILLVIIDPSGHVEVDRVISATNRDFEVEAVKAAEQCLFESPLKGGQKVSARYTWTIAFGQ
jgi:protein TonB